MLDFRSRISRLSYYIHSRNYVNKEKKAELTVCKIFKCFPKKLHTLVIFGNIFILHYKKTKNKNKKTNG